MAALTPYEDPELVFALVGPAGADIPGHVPTSLRGELGSLGYRVHDIKMSKLIEKFFDKNYDSEYEDDRIEKLMTDGTALRELTGRGDAIALLAVSEIKEKRKESGGRPEKNAYILNSLKHPAEITTLRNIYGLGFFVISIYSPRDLRVDQLEQRVTKSRGPKFEARSRAEELLARDEEELGRPLGQNVGKAFPEADLFIDARAKKQIRAQVIRFIELLFGNTFHTPTRDEYAMYHAKAAALRSADLGRQVGAVISTTEGDVIAVGCNDTPKAGGGLYWPDDAGDQRDFQRGSDASEEVKEQLFLELLSRLKEAGWLADEQKKANLLKLVQANLRQGGVFYKTQVSQLLEFGRSVHAEMAALMDAARRGTSVMGAILYSSTFPCHMCARHIVAAGITRVVYIEPYPKSKAKHLHQDSIAVDEAAPVAGKVNMEPFVGLAARQYLRLFNMNDSRKDKNGKMIEWKRGTAAPRLERFLNTYQDIETRIAAEVIPEMLEKRKEKRI